MLPLFHPPVRVILLGLALLNGCALRSQTLSSEMPAAGESDAIPLLAAVAASPTLDALLPTTQPTAQQALAATTGGVSFDALASEPTLRTQNKLVTVQLRNANTRDQFEVQIAKDGSVGEAQGALDAFFGCRRTGRIRPISPGVLRVIAAIAEEYPGKIIEVVSGYRAPPFGVKDSKHFAGRAIDLRVRGVKLAKVRDFVWKRFTDVGVGFYGPQNFIHVDHRPEEKDTAWSSAHENAVYEYNPRWAMKIRPPWQEPMQMIADDEHDHDHAHEGELAMSEPIESSVN